MIFILVLHSHSNLRFFQYMPNLNMLRKHAMHDIARNRNKMHLLFHGIGLRVGSGMIMVCNLFA